VQICFGDCSEEGANKGRDARAGGVVYVRADRREMHKINLRHLYHANQDKRKKR
jgi:hypothetical protein